MVTVKIADTARSFALDFHCDACGYRALALVCGVGRGYAHAFDGDEAKKRARAESRLHAKQTLHFVPCPACGERSAQGAALAWRCVLQHLGYTLIAPVLSIVYVLAQKVAGDAVPIILGLSAAIGIGAAFMTYITHAQPWQHVEDRVLMTSPKKA